MIKNKDFYRIGVNIYIRAIRKDREENTAISYLREQSHTARLREVWAKYRETFKA